MASPDTLTPGDRGAAGDRAFRGLALGAGITVLAILALIAISTTIDAWPALRHSGLQFITSDRWVPNDPDGNGPLTASFGALAFVFGTAVVSLIALVLAVPLSTGMACF